MVVALEKKVARLTQQLDQRTEPSLQHQRQLNVDLTAINRKLSEARTDRTDRCRNCSTSRWRRNWTALRVGAVRRNGRSGRNHGRAAAADRRGGLMPDVRISIGGRDFDVSCQPGEEHFLRAAAKLLDNEATTLISQIGRLPEARMLLMAGLMLADKTAGLEDQLRALEERAMVAERVATTARASQDRVEIPVLPQSVLTSMAEIASRAEALADRIEDQVA
jgi:cell division protein ZapA